MCKSWEDYSKNWMHFVYKLDHLFQSTRVSDENSSVAKTFHFSKLITTQNFFCIQHATFKSHILKFQPFLTSFAIFYAFNDLFSAKWPWNWKTLQPELRKGWNLAWYHHLTHITCVQKVERITTKTGWSLSTNWTISFKVRGFDTKTHLFQSHFIF